jgi:hypothetical protein
MLTDDELAQELRAAFRASSSELAYTGPVPRPRLSAAWLLLPAAAAGAAVAVPVLVSSGSPTPAPEPRTVTDTFALADRTVTHERPTDAPRLEGECSIEAVLNGSDEPCYLVATSIEPGEVPEGATKVDIEGVDQAWLYTEDGVTTLYLIGLDGGDYLVVNPSEGRH